MASARLTREGLAAAKAKGTKLGSAREGHWQGREDRRAAGFAKAVEAASAARSEETAKAYRFILPSIRERRSSGDTLDAIAAWLNAAGHQTRAGKPFTATAIHRLLKRAG